jgi:hypothetical protein
MTNIIKQGDTWPYLEFAFVDEDNLPVDCTGYNVKFIVRNWKKEIVIDTSIEDSLIENAAGAVWTNKTLGTGEYHWSPADTLKQGKFEYEFKFTRLSDGRVFTLPQSEFLEYEIKADVPWDSTYY